MHATTRLVMIFAIASATAPIVSQIEARRYRRQNEVTIHNYAEANIHLRCQSIKMDQKPTFLGPMMSYSFRFHDIDRGNRHFWCDALGLFGFFESFDVYGRSASSRTNQTWYLKNDGLYYNHQENRVIEWTWVYPPLDSYAIESMNAVDIGPLPV
ncbi:unnamed protein product [Caenorhabditis bovis]|uniref:S-protein homolog n=1 Tax=Caenorhabditis bovis TaxID=2654633 RepID=A0A8S1EXC8_9PELO|nr:unnamed protein product [Caenorhabditis bovis]